MTVLLHLCDVFFIRMEELLSIHDYEAVKERGRNVAFWRWAEGRTTDLSKGRQKAVVVTTNHVYISSISARTLRKRAEEACKGLMMTEV